MALFIQRKQFKVPYIDLKIISSTISVDKTQLVNKFTIKKQAKKLKTTTVGSVHFVI